MLQPKQPQDPKEKSKIFLVDDHPMVRERLAQLINQTKDMVVCGEADDSPEALQGIKNTTPDLAIIDITLKSTHGLELIKNLHALYPELPMLVVSMHEESLYAERVLRAGALGYITKLEATEKVLVALRQVLNGQIFLSEKMSARLVHKMVGRTSQTTFPVESLADRELEVFQLMGRGLRTKQIADELHLSPKSVETYRMRIKEKLKLKDSTELLLHALQWVHSLGTK